MDDFKIKFQGFTPSEFTRAYFNEVLQRLHEEAPASSFLKATITKVRDHFKAVVQINSAAGHFFATAQSERLTEVGQQIISRMHRQLDRWKTLRRTQKEGFTNEAKYG